MRQLPCGHRSVAEYLQLKSVASFLLNMHKIRFATHFGHEEVSVSGTDRTMVRVLSLTIM